MRPIAMPPIIQWAIDNGAVVAAGISGGKDGQAMLNALSDRLPSDQLFAIHSHLGRIEWKYALPHCHKTAADNGVELVVVGKDLMDHMWKRLRTIQASGESKPFWPSSAARYCTSDTKRNPINAYLTGRTPITHGTGVKNFCPQIIISAEGIRGQESKTRAKKPYVELRHGISAAYLKGLEPEQALEEWLRRGKEGRLAFTWNPIKDWSLDDVLEACGTSLEELNIRRRMYAIGATTEALAGWKLVAPYVFGNERFSCSICVLACKGDIKNGAKHNPGVYQEMLQMQRESGFIFRVNLDLETLSISGKQEDV